MPPILLEPPVAMWPLSKDEGAPVADVLQRRAAALQAFGGDVLGVTPAGVDSRTIRILPGVFAIQIDREALGRQRLHDLQSSGLVIRDQAWGRAGAVASLWGSRGAPPFFAPAGRRPTCGMGALVGMLDTRIHASHTEFAGRPFVHPPAEFDAAGRLVRQGPVATDHGTAVAGLVAGQHCGLTPGHQVAYGAVLTRLVAGRWVASTVQVLNGLDWLATTTFPGRMRAGCDVISLSFSTTVDATLTRRIQAVLAMGVPIVCAAGNGGARAQTEYPASLPEVVAVGAVDSRHRPHHDTPAATSGKPDVFAPGVGITAPSYPAIGHASFTGSSMATPIVAAAMASVVKANGTHPADGHLVAGQFCVAATPGGPRVLDLTRVCPPRP